MAASGFVRGVNTMRDTLYVYVYICMYNIYKYKCTIYIIYKCTITHDRCR